MRNMSFITAGRPGGRRSPRAAGAVLALGLVGLLTCTGCNELLRTVVRQGAYEVFQTGTETFYSELTTGLTDWIQQIGPSGAGSSTAGTSTTGTTGGTEGEATTGGGG